MGSARIVAVTPGSAGFYDFDEYERLVTAAHATERTAYLIVLLGGEGGLRCGEMMALEWSDVDLGKRSSATVRLEGPRDGHQERTIAPCTDDVRLSAALREHRHLRGAWVMCQRDGSPLTQKTRVWSHFGDVGSQSP